MEGEVGEDRDGALLNHVAAVQVVQPVERRQACPQPSLSTSQQRRYDIEMLACLTLDSQSGKRLKRERARTSCDCKAPGEAGQVVKASAEAGLGGVLDGQAAMNRGDVQRWDGSALQ